MRKPVQNLAMLLLVVFAIYGGFVWGRTLGYGPRHPVSRSLRDVSRLLASMDTTQDINATVPPSDIFDTVLDHIQREYVEGVDNSRKLSNGALARMFASLNDVKTYYLDPALRRTEQDALQGRFTGIGAVLVTTKTRQEDVEYNHLTVLDVVPGGPAERAGMQTGDYITQLNGHWIIDYSPREELDRLDTSKLDQEQITEKYNSIQTKFKKGYTLAKALPVLLSGTGTPLELQVVRNGQAEPTNVRLVTSAVNVAPVEYRALENHVGYLRIRQFNAKTNESVQNAVASLQGSASGLIIDVRSCAGGVHADPDADVDGYDAATKLIACLTNGGVAAMIERKVGQKDPVNVKPAKTSLHVPLLVLMDHGTANLAEMVAAALHDLGHAKLVGTRTFGDAILQLYAEFKNGGGVLMSNAHLFTAGGIDINKGLEPDIVDESPDPANDAELQRAQQMLAYGH